MEPDNSNMEPENELLEKETPFFEILNLDFHVEFQGCNKWLMVGRLTRLPFCVGKATKVKQDPRKITNRSELFRTWVCDIETRRVLSCV